MNRTKVASELVKLAKELLARRPRRDPVLVRLEEAVERAMSDINFAWDELAINDTTAVPMAKARYEKALKELDEYRAKIRPMTS